MKNYVGTAGKVLEFMFPVINLILIQFIIDQIFRISDLSALELA